MPLALNRAGVPPLPVDALEFFRQKAIEPGFSFEDVWAEEHQRAFTAAKFMREDILSATKEELARALSEGRTFEDFARSIEDRFIEMGWWGEQTVADPLTGQKDKVDVPSRLALIYDTNMRTARAAGQWKRIERTRDTHPYLVYLVGPSHRHRPEHLAWHGTMLPVDHPWWQTHFTPNGYGCKCHVRQVSKREAARLERDGIRAPEHQPVIGPSGLPTGHILGRRVPVRREAPPVRTIEYRNKRTGRIDRVPEGIDPGFHRPPSELTRFHQAGYARP